MKANTIPIEEGDIQVYSRKPVKMRFPKLWQHMTVRQSRENVIDRGSIYGPLMKQRLPRPGHRDILTKETADIGYKEERGFIRKMTGYPMSAHISGSAHARRSRQPRRQPTANTIYQEYQYIHKGLRGKMLLNNKSFPHGLPVCTCYHGDGEISHHCDVLGQRTCACCIEHTNKKMACEYQNDAFPYIETTAASLVAPKLSKVLTNHQNQIQRGDMQSMHYDNNVNEAVDTPLPYRMSSAIRDSKRVTIYNDAMIESLHKTLERDRRMTVKDIQELPSLTRKPSTLKHKTTPKGGSLLNFLFK